MLKTLVESVHPRIETLLAYHRRPLTIIYQNPVGLPDNLLAHDGSIAIRISSNPDNKALIEKYGKPLVATSANFSGRNFPKSFDQISQNLINKVDYIIESDEQKEDIMPSTMVKYTKKGELVFIRD